MKSNLSRRTILKFAAAGSVAFPAVANSAPDHGPVGPAQISDTDFLTLYAEWKQLYHADYSGMAEDEAGRLCRRYGELCDLISCLPTSSEKQFAIQYHVATDGGDSLPCTLFMNRMHGLLSSAEIALC